MNGFLVPVLVAVAFLALVGGLLYWANRVPDGAGTDRAARVETAKTVTEAIGIAVLGLGLFVALNQLTSVREQLSVDREQLLVDRSKLADEQAQRQREHRDQAVQKIQSAEPTVQIIGLFELSRAARDSASEQKTAAYADLDLLVSEFIRERAPCRPCSATPRALPQSIQVALQVLGEPDRPPRGGLVNLRGADLRGADLRGLNLSRVDFHDSNISGTNLAGADLRGADLREVRRHDVTGLDSVLDDDKTLWG